VCCQLCGDAILPRRKQDECVFLGGDDSSRQKALRPSRLAQLHAPELIELSKDEQRAAWFHTLASHAGENIQYDPRE
jgi:hypothetical protein